MTTWQKLPLAARDVQLQRSMLICTVRGSGNDEIFSQCGRRTVPTSHHLILNSGQGHVNPSLARHRTTRPPIKRQREGRGLHGKPRPSVTSRFLGRKEAASGWRPKLRRPTKATHAGVIYDANGRRRPSTWHCSGNVAAL
jgi:hypothetical protein